MNSAYCMLEPGAVVEKILVLSYCRIDAAEVHLVVPYPPQVGVNAISHVSFWLI